jgi:hypothetical protein
VKALVHCAFPQTASAWRSILAGRALLRGTSVFCHGRAIADMYPRGDPGAELGDLLIMHFQDDTAGQRRMTALLLQAKIAIDSWGEHTLSASEFHQLRLYETWPPFTYQKGRPFRGCRWVNPPSRHAGAQFLLLDQGAIRGIPRRPPPTIAMASRMLVPYTSLSQAMVDLLLFRTGRPFLDAPSALFTNGWSRLVWDLLLMARSVTTGARTPQNRPLSCDPNDEAVWERLMRGEPSPPSLHDDGDAPSDEQGGFGVVVIQSGPADEGPGNGNSGMTPPKDPTE